MNIHIHVARVEIHSHDSIKLDEILKQLLTITKNQTTMSGTLKDIQDQNAALIEAVAAEDTVIDSAVALITGFATTLADIKAQLAAAIAANDPVAIQAVADSLSATITDVNAKKQSLADAVAANTPSA